MTEGKVLSFEPKAEFYQKRARKALDKQDYIGALKSLNKAVRMEPHQIEYKLDLAHCYALMGLYERSNLELQLLLCRQDAPAEVLYAMGSNYMSMGDYDQAEVMMQTYLKQDPQGEFAAPAEDGLAYMAECDYETELDRELDELSMDGKAALDAGDLDHAIRCLETALEKDPEMLYVRNNLAVAYYCAGNMEKAWEHLDYVLDANPLDVHGRCNESMFYLAVPDEARAVEALQKLRLERIEELDELFKYCLALADAGMDEKLLQAIKKIFLQCPYDVTMLYLYGACLYNMGKWGEALEAFETLKCVDPDGLLAEQGAAFARSALRDGTPPCPRIAYTFDLPESILHQITQCMEDLQRMKPLEISDRMRQERLQGERTRKLLHAAVFAGTDVQMGIAVPVLGYAGCEDAERILREILLSPVHSTPYKQMALQAMHASSIQEPYHILKEGKLAVVHTRSTGLDPNLPDSYHRVLSDAPAHLAGVFGTNDAAMFAIEVWVAYILYLNGKYPRMNREFAWTKVIEGMYIELLGHEPDWKKLSAESYTTEKTLLNRKRKLEEAMRHIGTKNAKKKDGK